MPIYEYQCAKLCGKEFEEWQKFSDPGQSITCPDCGGHSRRSNLAIHVPCSRAPGGTLPIMRRGRQRSGEEALPRRRIQTSESKPSSTTTTSSKDA